MSHRTHSDGVPAPRRTTRAMFQPFLKSHAGGGVVERPAKAVSPPHVAVKRLGVKSGPCSKWTSRTPHRAFTVPPRAPAVNRLDLRNVKDAVRVRVASERDFKIVRGRPVQLQPDFHVPHVRAPRLDHDVGGYLRVRIRRHRLRRHENRASIPGRCRQNTYEAHHLAYYFPYAHLLVACCHYLLLCST